MKMDTSDIHIGQIPAIVPQTPDREKTGSGRGGTRKNEDQGIKRMGINVDVPRGHVAYGAIQSAQNHLSQLSKSIRVADQTMGRIEDFIDKMKQNLVTHLKNFPPFLQGSEERIELLKIFNSFRKQIDRLTFPPEDQLAGQIMGNDSKADNTDAPLTIDGDIQIRRQPVHTGENGLDIPPLPLDADDETIQEGIQQLDAAQAALRQRRSDLAQDLQVVLDQKSIN
jgi:hypothetical protein